MNTLDLSPTHLRVLRHLRVEWLAWESGGPAVLGLGGVRSGDDALIEEVRRVLATPTLSSEAAEGVYREAVFAARAAVNQGTLAPGHYTYEAAPETLDGSPFVQNENPDAQVDGTTVRVNAVTAPALQLLRRARFTEVDEGGTHILVGFDPKRPYGDMTSFEIDMAQILGIAPAGPFRQDYPELRALTEAQEAQLGALHELMEPVLQVFLRHAQLAPGRFQRDAVADWVRAS